MGGEMLAALVCVVVCLVVPCLSETCYSCKSDSDPACNETMDSYTSMATKSCNFAEDCGVEVRRAPGTTYSSYVERGCMSTFSGGSSTKSDTKELVYKETCTTDRCNTDIVSSLRECYKCTGAEGLESSACKTIDAETTSKEICEGSCAIITGSIGGLNSVERKCDKSCTAADIDIFGIKSKTTCCDTDLCNAGAGAARIAVSLGSLMVALLVPLSMY